METFLSGINRKYFNIVLGINFLLLIVFSLKKEKFTTVKIYNPNSTNNEILEEGIIDDKNHKIYLLDNNSTFSIKHYDLSDTDFVSKNLKVIGTTDIFDSTINEVYFRSHQYHKEVLLALFLLLLVIYLFAYLPGFIRAKKDEIKNESEIPYSYLENAEREKKLNFKCTVCKNTALPKLLKEEYIEGMQFVYIECMACKNKDKIRLK